MQYKARARRVKSDREFSHDESLEKLLAAAGRITAQLKVYARKYEALGDDDTFPEARTRKVRQAISSGLVESAARRMVVTDSQLTKRL